MRPLSIALIATVAACASTQSSYTPLSAGYEARPANHPIEIFRNDAPDRAYIIVAELDVHKEATHFITYGFDDAVPELKLQARAAGADAIIDVVELRSRYLETSIYHISAKAIRYSD